VWEVSGGRDEKGWNGKVKGLRTIHGLKEAAKKMNELFEMLEIVGKGTNHEC